MAADETWDPRRDAALALGASVSALVDFLLARLAEDEKDARSLIEQRAKLGPYEPSPGLAAWVVVPFDEDGHPGDPARVLAECEAKRRLVEHVVKFRRDVANASIWRGDEWADGRVAGWEDGVAGILEVLALPYADHPDYRPEWRP